MKRVILSLLTVVIIVALFFMQPASASTSEFKPLWPLAAYHINALDHYSGGSQHNGIDIAANGGTTVKAVAAGVVEQIYNGCTHISKVNDTCGSTWGNHVLIRHTINGTTYYSRYAHLQNNSIVVNVGSSVSAGQKIGLSGSSGSSSGYHLHLELYQGSRTAAKACQSFQYYRDNPSVLSGVTFSSHVPTSSVYFGDWVRNNCQYTNGVYKYVGESDPIDYVDFGDEFYSNITHMASGWGLYNRNGNVQLDMNNTTGSMWHFVQNSDGSYRILSGVDGEAMDVYDNATANGTNIQTYPYNGTSAQKWFIVESGNGYSFISANSKKALDIADGSTKFGANAQLYDANGSAAQIFELTVQRYALTANTNDLELNSDTGASRTVTYTVHGQPPVSWSIWFSCDYPLECEWGSWDGMSIPLTVTTQQIYSNTAPFLEVTLRDDSGTILTSCSFPVHTYSSYCWLDFDMSSGTGQVISSTLPSSVHALYGSEVTIPYTIPLCVGYTFEGWHDYTTGTRYYPGDTLILENDKVLYAVWRAGSYVSVIPGTFPADIDFGGKQWCYSFTPSQNASYQLVGLNNDYDTYVIIYDSAGNVLAYDDDSGDGYEFCLTYDMTANTTYYIYVKFYSSAATGNLNFGIYKGSTVSYDANGGSNAPESFISYGGLDMQYLSEQIPQRLQYKFLGWSESPTATTASYQPGGFFGCAYADTTLYAVWEKVEVTGICGDNLTWTLDTNDVLTISGTGAMDNYSNATNYAPWVDYGSMIKSVIIEEGVTSIGDMAFWYCALSDISIPSSLISIGDLAFYGDGHLSAISLPDSLRSIGGGAFNNCTALTSITIPDSVTELGAGVFYDCTNIRTVVIGNGITCIPEQAFSYCVYLESIVLGANVERIDYAAFHYATDIKTTICYNGTESEWAAISIDNTDSKNDGIITAAIYCGHNYSSQITAATCIKQGTEVKSCQACGHTTNKVLPATGHSSSYRATTNPTTSATGTLTGTCSKCSGTTTVTLPKLSTTDYSYAVTKAATCTATGTGRYTWKTTTYGSFYFDVSIPATGHSYGYKVTTAPTTSATGTLTGTCSKCSGTTTVTLPKLNTTDYGYAVTKAATCTATGTGRYTWKTTTYGSFYFDVSIPATGHSYTSKVTAPTCTAQGYTTYTCSCGHSYKDSYTDATGHSYGYKVTTAPTTSATGTLTGTCSKCSGTTTVTLPKLSTTDYSYAVTKAATCTATGTGRYTWKTTTYGSFYFDVSIPATGHSYTSKVTAPTCTAQGYTTYTCSKCSNSYKDSYTNATGHSYSYKVTTAPTTSATGTLTGTCSKCSGTTTVTLPKLNTTDYSYAVTKAATCTATGTGRYTWKTTTYGSFYFDVSIPATGHSYTSKVTAPTCTAQGYTTYTCSCGHSYKDSYTDATGHSYGYKVTTAPTTSATGTLTGTCSKCSSTSTVTLHKLSTTRYTYQVTKAATCTEDGTGRYTWKTYTYGYYYFDVTIPATGHIYEDDCCVNCGERVPDRVVINYASELTSVYAKAGTSTWYAISSALNEMEIYIVHVDGMTVTLNGNVLIANEHGMYCGILNGAPSNLLIVSSESTDIETFAAIEYPLGSEYNPYIVEDASELSLIDVDAYESVYYAISEELNGMYLRITGNGKISITLNDTALSASNGVYAVKLAGAPSNLLIVTNRGSGVLSLPAEISDNGDGAETNARIVNSNGDIYMTLTDAVKNYTAGQYLILKADIAEDVALTKDFCINLNGFDLTGTITTNGYKIYGMDSTTDGYTCEAIGYFNCVDENGKAIVPVTHFKSDITGTTRRYMAIQDENGYSFHRFYLGITHQSLKPSTTGVGYKAVFYGDSMVAANLDSFGFTMQLGNYRPKTVAKDASGFVSGKIFTLRIDNFDVENYGETELYASVILKLADGTMIESVPCVMTLRGLLETLNENYTSLTDSQLAAVADFIEQHDIILSWNIENLAFKPPEAYPYF